MIEKRVLVTGASKGIGRAIALELAEVGWIIALHCGHDKVASEQVAVELGNRCSGIYVADLSDPKEAAALPARVLADGPAQALVNNAGAYVPMSFADNDAKAAHENFCEAMQLNFLSPAMLSHSFTKHFCENGGGKILNVASRVGFKGEAGASGYAASKAALINLTRSLAVELATRNIQVFGIAPGWVETAMARDGMRERLSDILDTIPIGRMASPEDCAAASRFLLSDDAAYLSGTTLDINGASYFH